MVARTAKASARSRKRGRLTWAVVAAVIAVTVVGLWCWRTPVLEVKPDGDEPPSFVKMGNDQQFALAWTEYPDEGGEAFRVVVLEAAADGELAIVTSTHEFGTTGSWLPEIQDRTVRVRINETNDHTLIYGGGQMLLCPRFRDGADLTIRYRRVPVVVLWGRV